MESPLSQSRWVRPNHNCCDVCTQWEHTAKIPPPFAGLCNHPFWGIVTDSRFRCNYFHLKEGLPMARIQITTSVPANTEVAYARTQARIQAAEAVSLHIVEESLLPTNPDGPNDSSSDRVLTTVWDFIGGSAG